MVQVISNFLERGSNMAMFDIYLYLEPVCVLSSTYFSGGGGV